MKNIRLITLEQISLEELTDLWNLCWRGYYYNMTYTLEHMKVWLYLSQVSLLNSRAIIVDNQIAGFALLSLDGSDSWIAGTCINPAYRRNGLFAPLMRSQLSVASSVGLKRVYLEVLEQNHALKVYQALGFTRLRQLNIYRSPSRINFHTKASLLEKVPVEQYFENRHRAFFNPPWQRRDKYLKRHKHILALMNLAGSAGALFAGDRNAPCLDAWSISEAGAGEVISSVINRLNGSFSLTNQPNDWIVSLLSAYRISPCAKQLEMCIELN